MTSHTHPPGNNNDEPKNVPTIGSNTCWDRLPQNQVNVRSINFADAALQSIRAGEATAITFNEDGEIAPQ
ncbi:MAG: hypothetical protein R2856_27495 [Caldilineaceae bacterium]